jgi:hypothetical protein
LPYCECGNGSPDSARQETVYSKNLKIINYKKIIKKIELFSKNLLFSGGLFRPYRQQRRGRRLPEECCPLRRDGKHLGEGGARRQHEVCHAERLPHWKQDASH